MEDDEASSSLDPAEVEAKKRELVMKVGAMVVVAAGEAVGAIVVAESDGAVDAASREVRCAVELHLPWGCKSRVERSSTSLEDDMFVLKRTLPQVLDQCGQKPWWLAMATTATVRKVDERFWWWW